MPTHKRPGALAVQIEIADVKLLGGFFQLVTVLGVHGAGETVLGIVRDLERFIEVFGLDHGKHGTEDLLLGDFSRGGNIRDHGRFDEITIAGNLTAAAHQASFLLPVFHIFQD